MQGTLAFLVSQGHCQIHRGVARICFCRQVSTASCKQAVAVRAQRAPADTASPLGPVQGEETPKKHPSWPGSAPLHPQAAQSFPPGTSRSVPTAVTDKPQLEAEDLARIFPVT